MKFAVEILDAIPILVPVFFFLNLISTRAHFYVQAMCEVCSKNFGCNPNPRSRVFFFLFIYKRKFPFANFNVIRSLNL